jgi:hypothetical protein
LSTKERFTVLQTALDQFQKLRPPHSVSQHGGRTLNRRVILLVVALATMTCYFAPFLLLGGRSYFNIEDTLDDEFVTNYLLVKTGKALVLDGTTPIDNMMNGIPRGTLPSGLSVPILLFYVFPPAWAYIVNFILVHTIGFCGMFVLLRRHFLTKDDDYLLAGAISICFFLVPYYTVYGATVAGQPLLAYAFLNIRKAEGSLKDYLVILLFPLWSTMVLIAPFAATALGLILTTDWVRSRRLNRQFLIAILFFISVYLALQYQLVDSILGAHLGSHSWVSHRITWNRWNSFGISHDIWKTFDILRTTQFHSGRFSTFPAIIAFAAALGLLFAGKRRMSLVDVLAIAILLVCLEYGFWAWLFRWFGWILRNSQAFNGSRFFFLLPLLWMLIFALSLKELKRVKWGLAFTWCLIAIQAVVILGFNTEYKHTGRLLIGKHVYEPSFDRFFAQDLFTEIDKYIGRPKDSYRVVSIGMYASISEFNGFYTLDGYLNNYSLAYKREFRKIIWKELNKSAELREMFDDWGNRCYIFSSEIGGNSWAPAEAHVVLHNLELDTNQLRAMGGEYVISAARIENSEQMGLRLEKEFYSSTSFWHIYLYYVLPTVPAPVASANPTENAAVDKRRDGAGGRGPKEH